MTEWLYISIISDVSTILWLSTHELLSIFWKSWIKLAVLYAKDMYMVCKECYAANYFWDYTLKH